MARRKLEVAVLSDLHLGTYGCQAKEIVNYLKDIDPEVLILNGDIIDIWQFSKRYWPKAHMQVLREVMKHLARGAEVYYLTGNHDELLRKFSDFHLANFHLQDKLVLELDGEHAWFFHGDIFDASMKHAKWLAKLGAMGYDLLILINSMINWFWVRMGREKFSLSKKVKASVKKAVKFIGDFEEIAAELAIDQGYQYVVCGHIHQPQMRIIENEHGSVMYLNSGDWVENLTALEYTEGAWSLFQYKEEEEKSEAIAKLSDSKKKKKAAIFDAEAPGLEGLNGHSVKNPGISQQNK